MQPTSACGNQPEEPGMTSPQRLIARLLILLVIALCYPIAVSGKAIGVLAYFLCVAFVVAYSIRFARKFLPFVWMCSIVFALSFILPIDVVFRSDNQLAVSFQNSEDLDRSERTVLIDGTKYLIESEYRPSLGVQPEWLIVVSVP